MKRLCCGVRQKSKEKVASEETPFISPIGQKLNRCLRELMACEHGKEETVYCYVIATIKRQGAKFTQAGSAPNFQGDRISLCTCKHRMRTFMDATCWNGKWIAGFCGKSVGEGSNFLVYLMKVGQAFESHYDMWEDLHPNTKTAKSASDHNLGDLFKPKLLGKSLAGDERFNPENYHPPVKGHPHEQLPMWHKDINYLKGCKGRKPSLLVGSTKYSFVWDRPIIKAKFPVVRGQEKMTMEKFLAHLTNGSHAKNTI